MALFNVHTWRDWVSCGVRVQQPFNGGLFEIWSGPPLRVKDPGFGVVLGDTKAMSYQTYLELMAEHRIALALDKPTPFVAVSSA